MDDRERKEIEREIHKKALSRVRARVGFRWHLAAFVLINAALFAINHAYTPNTMWFVWPLAGWGVALAFHAFAVFQSSGSTDAMIEEEIRREMARRGLT